MRVRRPSSTGMAWRMALTVTLCAAVGVTLHFAWVAGYRANPAHPSRPVGSPPVVGLVSHLIDWWRYLLPTFGLVAASVFHELVSDSLSAVAAGAWASVRRLFGRRHGRR